MARSFKYHTEEEKRIGRNLMQRMRRLKNAEKVKQYNKEWIIKNKERYDAYMKEYSIKKREHKSIYNKEWVKNNRDKKRETHRLGQRRRRQDETYNFYCHIRSFILASFKRNKRNITKTLKSEIILGCTLDKFRVYVLSKCPEGTTLKDFGRYGYHIDHIIPISTANTKEEVIKLCHYTNLQPLWCTENLAKSNKIIEYV